MFEEPPSTYASSTRTGSICETPKPTSVRGTAVESCRVESPRWNSVDVGGRSTSNGRATRACDPPAIGFGTAPLDSALAGSTDIREPCQVCAGERGRRRGSPPSAGCQEISSLYSGSTRRDRVPVLRHGPHVRLRVWLSVGREQGPIWDQREGAWKVGDAGYQGSPPRCRRRIIDEEAGLPGTRKIRCAAGRCRPADGRNTSSISPAVISGDVVSGYSIATRMSRPDPRRRRLGCERLRRFLPRRSGDSVRVSEDDAAAAIEAALETGYRYFDSGRVGGAATGQGAGRSRRRRQGLHQGGPHHRRGRTAPAGRLVRRRPRRSDLRLLRRRRAALARRQFRADGLQLRGRGIHPRPRRSRATGTHRGLPGAGATARRGRGRRHRRGHEPARPADPVRDRDRDRRGADRGALQPPGSRSRGGTVRRGHGPRRAPGGRRGLQLRRPHRRRRAQVLQLRARLGANSGADRAARTGLRPLRRAPAGRGGAVRGTPRSRRDHSHRRKHRLGGRRELGVPPPQPARRLVARSRAGRRAELRDVDTRP